MRLHLAASESRQRQGAAPAQGTRQVLPGQGTALASPSAHMVLQSSGGQNQCVATAQDTYEQV